MPDPDPIPVLTEGRNTQFVLIDETAFGTIEPATVAGIALPYMDYDIPEKESEVDVAQASGAPVRAPLSGEITVSGSVKHAAVIDATPWLLKHYIDIPTTTGAAAPYTHVMTVGDNGLPPGLEVEEQASDLTLGNTRSWAGRGSSLRWGVTGTGGIIFDAGLEFLRQEAASGTAAVASPTAYLSEPIDQILAVISIEGSPVGVIASLTGGIDWHLETNKRGAGNAGKRVSLARGTPTVNGSIGVFLDDDTAPDVIGYAKAKTRISLSVVWTVEAVNQIVTWSMTAIKLYLQGRPVNSEQGVMCNFNFRAADCTWTWVNAVASYA